MDHFDTVILMLLHLDVQDLDQIGQFEEVEHLESLFFGFMVRFFLLFEAPTTRSRS